MFCLYGMRQHVYCVMAVHACGCAACFGGIIFHALPKLGSCSTGAYLVGCLYVQNIFLDVWAPCRVATGWLEPGFWRRLVDCSSKTCCKYVFLETPLQGLKQQLFQWAVAVVFRRLASQVIIVLYYRQ